MNETVAAVGPWLEYLDLAGIAFFALSGALVAAAKRQTLVTFIFFAVITGVGGGTVRDLLIGAPVFWIATNVILFICLAARSAERRVGKECVSTFNSRGSPDH